MAWRRFQRTPGAEAIGSASSVPWAFKPARRPNHTLPAHVMLVGATLSASFRDFRRCTMKYDSRKTTLESHMLEWILVSLSLLTCSDYSYHAHAACPGVIVIYMTRLLHSTPVAFLVLLGTLGPGQVGCRQASPNHCEYRRLV